MAAGKRRFVVWSAPLLAAVLLTVAHPWWLAALGRALVYAEQPFPAELVVVLAGDFLGHRITKGAELVREGLAPKALVSGPSGLYGRYESDLAIPFAVAKGYPESYFEGLRMDALSTRQEAAVILAELRRRKVRRFMVVTSDFHSARARRIYRSMAPECEFRFVTAPDEFFRPGEWWRTREGRKVFAIEALKTAADWLGM